MSMGDGGGQQRACSVPPRSLKVFLSGAESGWWGLVCWQGFLPPVVSKLQDRDSAMGGCVVCAGPLVLPETLMGTMLVCTEQNWCRCFSSTVGRGKALGQAVCLSGVVGRLREVSGGLTPSVLALLLSSSSTRRLGGISTNSRRLEGRGWGEGSVGVLGDGCPVARKVCPVTLLSAYCSSYSSCNMLCRLS